MANALWLGTKLSGAALSSYLGKQLPNTLRTHSQQAALKAMLLIDADVKQKAFGGKVERKGLFYSSAAGNTLANRTGESRNRISSSTFMRGATVFAVVGSPDKHVLMNEIGGDIKPKGGGSLAIPTANMMTSTGRLKDKWAGVFAHGGWRDVDWKKERLFIYRGKKGSKKSGGWIAQTVYRGGSAAPKRGAGGRMKSAGSIVLLAKLVKVVRLAARHMFLASMRRTSAPVANLFNVAVSTALQVRAR